ncbi:MAG: hypothetical protein OEV64_02920 [Desulfobulbaceae bacterium]|nr:hypothetical protein [Desulfobulbaceae bacterium]
MKNLIILSLLGVILSLSFGCAGHHDRKKATTPIIVPKGNDPKRQPIIVPEKKDAKRQPATVPAKKDVKRHSEVVSEKESTRHHHEWKKHEKNNKNKYKDRYPVCFKGKTKLVKEKDVEKFLDKGAYFGHCR